MSSLFFFFAKMGQIVKVEDDIGGEVILSRPVSLFFLKDNVVMLNDVLFYLEKVKSSSYMTTSLFKIFFFVKMNQFHRF